MYMDNFSNPAKKASITSQRSQKCRKCFKKAPGNSTVWTHLIWLSTSLYATLQVETHQCNILVHVIFFEVLGFVRCVFLCENSVIYFFYLEFVELASFLSKLTNIKFMFSKNMLLKHG